jgi:hypothetical protein
MTPQIAVGSFIWGCPNPIDEFGFGARKPSAWHATFITQLQVAAWRSVCNPGLAPGVRTKYKKTSKAPPSKPFQPKCS